MGKEMFFSEIECFVLSCQYKLELNENYKNSGIKIEESYSDKLK